MMRSKRYLTVIVIVSICLSQLISPIMVRADGETDPPPTETGEVVPPPESTDEAVDLAATETAEATSTPDPDELLLEPAETDIPVVGEVDAADPASEALEEISSETVLEVLDGLPAETSIIVLDEAGQVEPLATEEAAEAILVGDPVWCPAGQAPTPGSNGCSGSFGNLSALVAGFIPTGNGTIWIQSGVDSGTSVWIDGSAGWAAASNYSLTLQGGWSGTSGDATIGSNSVFDTQIKITNWNNTLTFNNITMNSVVTSALYLNNVQNVNVNNSEFTDNNNKGVNIDSANNVTILGSTFSDNNSYGIKMDTVNNVSISNSTFSENTDIGALVQIANDVSITNSTFSNNDSFGTLITDTTGDIAISGSTFVSNVMYGASMYHVADVTISNSSFESQDDIGLIIQNSDDVNISGSTFGSNGDGDSYDAGFSIDHGHDIAISGSTFNGNDGSGADISAANNVTISGSAFNGNKDNGAFMDVSNNVTISDSVFSSNTNWDGLYIYADADVSISNSTFNDNGRFGTGIVGSGNVFVSGSTFSGNDLFGAYAQHVGNVYVSGSTFNNNETGAALWSIDNVVISNSTFSNNTYGVDLGDDKNVSISDSVFNGNHSYGAWIEDTFFIHIANSLFQDNGASAIYYSVDPAYSPGSVFHLTLECNQYQNNAGKIEMYGDVTLTEIFCENNPGKPVAPLIIVITVPADADHIEFDMNCSRGEIYRVEWANGDKMQLSCVPEARVRISRLDNTDLSKDLPEGFWYTVSYNIEIFQNGVPVEIMPSSGLIQLSLTAQDEEIEHGIMYWNDQTNDWTILDEFQQNANGSSVIFPLNASNPRDGYKILKGVQHVDAQSPHREQVTTNFTGIFVLVQR